jgi:hypothetical protein
MASESLQKKNDTSNKRPFSQEVLCFNRHDIHLQHMKV